MANKLFGSKIRELRNNAGLTQQQLADKLSIKNKSTVGSWECGKSEPDAYTFLRLCKIFGVKNIISEFNPYITPEAEETIFLNGECRPILDVGIDETIESKISSTQDDSQAKEKSVSDIIRTNAALHDKLDRLDADDLRTADSMIDSMLKSAKYEIAATAKQKLA